MAKFNVEDVVANLNNSYMKKSKNEFKVSRAYGGCQIVLTGKSKKVRGKWVYSGIGSGQSSITYGYVSSQETLAQLAVLMSNKDEFKRRIQYWEKAK